MKCNDHTTMAQYLYVLKLRDDLFDDQNWTNTDHLIVRKHFERLQQDCKTGNVILAGRTTNTDKTSFGIVIFEASSEDEAFVYMKNDPAIKNGIMKGTLFPYRVAVMKKN